VTIQPLAARCTACDQPCEVETVVDAPIFAFTASLRATKCPHCGAGWKKLVIEVKPKEAECRS
jgi:NAD-dependent SIR2 family protein deacetylase